MPAVAAADCSDFREALDETTVQSRDVCVNSADVRGTFWGVRKIVDMGTELLYRSINPYTAI